MTIKLTQRGSHLPEIAFEIAYLYIIIYVQGSRKKIIIFQVAKSHRIRITSKATFKMGIRTHM